MPIADSDESTDSEDDDDDVDSNASTIVDDQPKTSKRNDRTSSQLVVGLIVTYYSIMHIVLNAYN